MKKILFMCVLGIGLTPMMTLASDANVVVTSAIGIKVYKKKPVVKHRYVLPETVVVLPKKRMWLKPMWRKPWYGNRVIIVR